MANLLFLETITCCNDKKLDLIVDDPTSAITTGNTYSFTTSDETLCATVTSIKSTGLRPTSTFEGNYTSCEECLSGNSTVVVVTDCGTEGQTYFVDITTFTTLPSFGDVYYMTLTLDDVTISNCFTIDCFASPEDGQKILSLTSISDLYSDCTECSISNIETYSVTPCITSSIDTYYINLPLGVDYTGYIINFTNESGESICGTVDGPLPNETNGTLISILGPSGDVSCDDCLAISTEKRIITNCIDNTTEVVWGSVFYEGSEVTNLSTTDGCFEVGDLTESAVTITTYLDYNPQPSCQECIQCNGVVYSFSSCTDSGALLGVTYGTGGSSTFDDGSYGPFTGTTDGNGFGAYFYINIESNIVVGGSYTYGTWGYQVGDTITVDRTLFGGSDDLVITVDTITSTGGFLSYQYVQSPIGKTLFLPFFNDCIEITDVSTDGVYGYVVYSFDVFDNCTLCNDEENIFVWKTQDCATGQNYIVTVSSNSFTTGDYVKVKWGTTDFQCHQLLSPYDYLTDGVLTPFKSETLTPFDDCETCNSSTLIGASIIKCGGGRQQFVNIPINIWNTMAYTDSQLVFVTNAYGQCNILLNNCPLEPNYDTITPESTYYNCLTCYLENTRFPRSANTETFICVQVCTESGTTVVSVVPPHPVWTDGFGTPVTQMNMVVIGGPDGLNS